MKSRRYRNLSAILFILIILIGCGTTKKVLIRDKLVIERKGNTVIKLDPPAAVKTGKLTITIEVDKEVDMKTSAKVEIIRKSDFQKKSQTDKFVVKGKWENDDTWIGSFDVKNDTPNGNYIVKITGVNDIKTNLLKFDEYPFKIDTIPPSVRKASVKILKRPEADYEKTKFKIKDISDDNKIAKYYYSYKNKGGTTEGLESLNGECLLKHFPESNVNFYVWAMDEAGNIGKSYKKTIFSDTTRPKVVKVEKIGSIGKDPKIGGLFITFSEDMNTDIFPVVSFGKKSPYEDGKADYRQEWLDKKAWRGWYEMDKLNAYLGNEMVISKARDVYGNDMLKDKGRDFPIDANALFFYGLTFYEKKEYKQALMIFEDVNELDEYHVNAYIYRGNILRLLDDVDEAMEVLEKALEIEPHSAAANFQMGLCDQEEKELVKASRKLSYARSIRRKFDNFPARFSLKNLDRIDVVEYDYEISDYTPPSQSQILEGMGVGHAKEKQYQKAIDELTEAQKMDEKNWCAYYNLGKVFCHLGQYENAIETLEISASINPDNNKILNNIGVVYFRQGKRDKAKDYFENALRISNEDKIASHNMSILNITKANAKAKIKTLKKYRKLDSPEVYNNLAVCSKLIKDSGDAVSYYEDALDEKEDYALASGEAGEVLFTMKKYKKAKKFLKEAVKEHPNYLRANYNLGLLYLNTGYNQLAENQFNRVLKIAPNYPDAISNLSIVYNRKNLFDESVQARREAERLFRDGYSHGETGALAIMTFKNISKSKKYDWLKVGIPEALQTDLKNLGGINLIERIEIAKIMKQQEIKMTKAMEKESASEMGQLIGASDIVIGGYQIMGKTIRVDARVVKAETGEIARTVTVDGKIDDILKLEKKLAKKLAGYYVPDVEGIGLGQSMNSMKGFELLAQSKMSFYAGEMSKAREFLDKALSEDDAVRKDLTYISVIKEEKLKAEGGRVAKLAVSFFKNNSGIKKYNWLEKGIAEALTTDLKKVGSIQLVERMNIDIALKEMELGMTGIVDEGTAPKFGKLSGAGVVLFGSFQIVGNKIRIDARIIDVETQAVIMTESITGPMKDVLELEENLAMKILAALNVAVTNIERRKILEKATISLQELKDEITGGAKVVTAGGFTGEATRCIVKDNTDKIIPCISPEKTFIVFSVKKGKARGLYRFNINSSRKKKLVDGEILSVDISPNGKNIVYALKKGGNADIWLMSLEDRKKTQLTKHKEDDEDPVFSPDGHFVAFASSREGNYDIHIINLASKKLTKITSSRADERYPSWSPYGDALVYQSDGEGNWDIYTIRRSGRGEKQITALSSDEKNPSWSPDGNKIVFTSNLSGKENLWVQNVDGTKLFKLTKQPSYFPKWTSDGMGIIYSMGKSNKRNIWLIE